MKKAKNRYFKSGLRDLKIGQDRNYVKTRVSRLRIKLEPTVTQTKQKSTTTTHVIVRGGRMKTTVSKGGFYASNKNKVSDTVKPPVRPPTRRVASSIGKNKR